MLICKVFYNILQITFGALAFLINQPSSANLYSNKLFHYSFYDNFLRSASGAMIRHRECAWMWNEFKCFKEGRRKSVFQCKYLRFSCAVGKQRQNSISKAHLLSITLNVGVNSLSLCMYGLTLSLPWVVDVGVNILRVVVIWGLVTSFLSSLTYRPCILDVLRCVFVNLIMGGLC